MELYPLQFHPIFKERIWGGIKLKTHLDKPITSENIGESWEISAVKSDVSMVANGVYKGTSLQDLIEQFPEDLLGTEVYKKFGKHFPLLFKFLDAQEDLSIQVHPNDELAKSRHNSFGKTEMWYVMQADENSKLIVGFKEKTNPEIYKQHMENKSLLELFNIQTIKRGDVFLLDAGIVHAIGAGTMIAEIQETSDITYRIYDFDRVDVNGNKRELHTDLAMEAINFDVINAEREYLKEINISNKIVSCPYFTTNFIPLDGLMQFEKNQKTFTVYMCVDGNFSMNYKGKDSFYKKGDTILIPAAITSFELEGQASILEIYIS